MGPFLPSPSKWITDPMEGAGHGNQLGKGEAMCAKPLGSAVKKRNWGCAFLAGPALVPTQLVVISFSHLWVPQHSISWAELCLCQQPTPPDQGRPVPAHS